MVTVGNTCPGPAFSPPQEASPTSPSGSASIRSRSAQAIPSPAGPAIASAAGRSAGKAAPSVRIADLSHPDVAGDLALIEHNFVPGDGNLARDLVRVAQRQPRAMRVKDRDRGSIRLPGLGIDGVGPDAVERVAV